MANLGQVCLFSNLIPIPVYWCGFWVSAVGAALFIPIQLRNLLEDDQNFKMVRGCKKEEDQISMREVFFSLASIKLSFLD